MKKPPYSTLLIQLQSTTRELERLRYIHLPRFRGKVGEPDQVVINLANEVIDKAINGED